MTWNALSLHIWSLPFPPSCILCKISSIPGSMYVYLLTGAGKGHVPEEHGCHFSYLLHWVASDSDSWDSVSQFQTRQLHSVCCLGVRLGRIGSLNWTGCCHSTAAVPCSLSLPLDRKIYYFSENWVVVARLLANHFCSKKLHLFQFISVFLPRI